VGKFDHLVDAGYHLVDCPLFPDFRLKNVKKPYISIYQQDSEFSFWEMGGASFSRKKLK
jgi:hypothetical protein